ncbi:MAG: nuclear transport factor 2 family protein [Gemmatimonadetes bacterium]|nr:nuclear transport factor 2 family protein [Gemmatimonadota bacterium]NNF11876.1 nuclear transport factor 2 family protein [Gemmatimonadota bacterium]
MADLTQEDRDRLRYMTETDWVAACLNSDWDAAVALCTGDVDYMPADLPWLHGRAEVKDFLNNFPELVDFSQRVVATTGDTSLAVIHATFGGTFVVEGQQVTGDGKVLATARRDDGSWHFSSVCWNWNAPPAPSN